MLLISQPTLWNEHFSSPPYALASCYTSFLVRIDFQHFILCSVTWRLSASVTSSGPSRPFHRSTVSFMSLSLLSPSSGGRRSPVSWMAGTVWRIHSSCFSLHFTSSFTTFYFSAALSSSPVISCFQLSVSVKYIMTITERQETTQRQTWCLGVCRWTECWQKWCNWLLLRLIWYLYND